MGRSFPINEIQKRLPELIDQVAAERDEPIAVTVDGETAMLLVDPHHYELLRRLWDRHWEAVREIQKHNADVDPEEIYRAVTDVVEEVRQKQYDERTASASRLD